MAEKEVRLIDANALLSKPIPFEDISYHKLFNDDYTHGFNDALSWVRSAIEETSTIDPESLRPKGKWVYHPKASWCGQDVWECSNCGTYYNWVAENNYCSNCGAKMEE